VILSNDDTFSVERAWLSSQVVGRSESGALTNTLQSYEKEIIERLWRKATEKLLGQMAQPPGSECGDDAGCEN